MEIDNGTAITGVITSMAFLLPIILLSFNNKKKKNKGFNKLKTFAKKENLTIHEQENCGSLFLGIDNMNRTLLVYDTTHEGDVINQAKLEDCVSCTVVKTYVEKSKENTGTAVISNIELVFENSKKQIFASIELFKLERHHQLFGELQLAEQWAAKINKLLKKPI